MSNENRPTSAERSDAAHRFVDALEEAHLALAKADGILRERREPKGVPFPLFPFIGDKLHSKIGAARDVLWTTKDVAAVQAFDDGRKAAREQTDA